MKEIPTILSSRKEINLRRENLYICQMATFNEMKNQWTYWKDNPPILQQVLSTLQLSFS